MRIAVVGAGPAGIYTTEALVDAGVRHVDVLDALPTPFGLVRYGVAPDHLKIKSVAGALARILDQPEVRFVGNVRVGTDVSVEQLRELYDGVVYTFGASLDRRLQIPGEELPGVLSATDFVAWYCGHPDAAIRDLTISARHAVVIGVGNVGVDVARMLAKPEQDLAHTDAPGPVFKALARSSVTDISLVGRRGPADAKFTTKELRELGEIGNADVIVDSADLVLDDAGQARYDSDAAIRRNVDVLREWATRVPKGRPRRLHLRFFLQPVGVVGAKSAEGVRFDRARPGSPGEQVEIEGQLVVRAVGYRGIGLPGLPFDADSGTIPNGAGRIVRDGQPSYGEYTAGWIKRGPTGVIGTNRSDALETVTTLLDDARSGHLPPRPFGGGEVELCALLRQRGVELVHWDGWLAVERAEAELGAQHQRPRMKLSDRESLLAAARSAAAPV